MSSREVFLARVRDARGDGPAPPPARTYRRGGALAPADRVALFMDRAADYRARVERTDDVAGVVASTGALRLLVPDGVPGSWLPSGVEAVRDDGLKIGRAHV